MHLQNDVVCNKFSFHVRHED